MVPHSIITVSLATAILPRLSAPRRRRRPRRAGPARWPHAAHRAGRDRPFALLLPVIATDLADVIWGYGAGRGDRTSCYAPTLALFGVGLRLLHRPLPDAARLLRPRADPHGLLDPVRRSRRPTSPPPWCCVGRTDRRAHLAGAGARLRRGVRRRLGRRRTPCCARLLGGLRTPGAGAVPGPAGARRRAARPRPRCRVGRGCCTRAERRPTPSWSPAVRGRWWSRSSTSSCSCVARAAAAARAR